MKLGTVNTVRQLDICLSCEACAAVCPRDAVTMEFALGQFLPKIDEKRCNHCSLCLEICPGVDIDPLGIRFNEISEKMFDGPVLDCYSGYCKELNIRKNSASGGMITPLILDLVKNKKFDAAFILPFDIFANKPARIIASNDTNVILRSAKSKYIPVSIYNVLTTLKKQEKARYIFVGTPCQISTIKKFLKKMNISENSILFLGLFCEKTLNFNIYIFFEKLFKRANEKLIKFEFKNKEKSGWPGNSKLYFNSGRNLIVDKTLRMKVKQFFQLKRCLFCTDKLNQSSDISFGDCYIKGEEEFYGISSIIVRSQKGRDVFNECSHLFTLNKKDIKEIRDSQDLKSKLENLGFIKEFFHKQDNSFKATPDYKINRSISRKLTKNEKFIEWGKNCTIIKITAYLWFVKLLRLRNKLNFLLKFATLWLTIVPGGYIRSFRNKKRQSPKKFIKKNIIIVGGELYNKGAQAMTFTVVDRVKQIFPDKDIYLFSNDDFKRPKDEKNKYTFSILPWDFDIKLSLLNPINKFFVNNTYNKKMESHIRDVIKEADFFIDISGYALSSQWGFMSSVDYLLNIIIAKKFLALFYIFPQSIGPFDYGWKGRMFLYPIMKLYLKYPAKIFVRERMGMESLRKFTESNVEKSLDIVLMNKKSNLHNIYKNKNEDPRNIIIETHSVGIIPNKKVFSRMDSKVFYSIYIDIINKLLASGKRVYLLRHSFEDLNICRQLKGHYQDDDRVMLISEDLSAFELEDIIKFFDFLIASRYHSIIHAYKKGVPALVIGWAEKYRELLQEFDQLNYLYDVRNGINPSILLQALDKLLVNYPTERSKIMNKMDSVNKEDIFNILRN